jgi:tetratricopeptide (TPR) repeat protein
LRIKALFLLLCLLGLPLDVEASPAAEARGPASLEHSVTEAERLFRLGHAAEGEADKRKFHEEGFRLAEEARALQPNDPGALLQWTMHASAIAALDKNLAALKRIKEIEATLLRLKELAPAYRHAAADRTLGLLYRNAPMIISIGSTARAGRHLKEAYAKDPSYPGNCIFLADFYLSEGEKREARRLAKECGTDDQIAKFPEDAAEWTRLARRILDKTRG